MPDSDPRRFGDATAMIVYDGEGFQLNPRTGERAPEGGQVDPKTGLTVKEPVDLVTGQRVSYGR